MGQKKCRVCGDYYDSNEKICPYCGDGRGEKSSLEKDIQKSFDSKPRTRTPKTFNVLIMILLSFFVFLGILAMVLYTNLVSDKVHSEEPIVVTEVSESVELSEIIEHFSTDHVDIEGEIHDVITYVPSDNNIISIDFRDDYVESLEFSTANEPFYLYYNFDEFYYDIASYYDYENEYFLDENGYIMEDYVFHVIIGNFDELSDKEMIINVEHPSGLFSTKIFKILTFTDEELIVELFTTSEFEKMTLEDNGLLSVSFDKYTEYYHFIDNDVIFIGTSDDYTKSEAIEYLYTPYTIGNIKHDDSILSNELFDTLHQNGVHFAGDLPFDITIEGLYEDTMNTILIYNGDFSSYDNYTAHGRIKAFTITFPDGSQEAYEFHEDDTSVLFFFDNKEVDQVVITITELYEGDIYPGFFLSEIRAYQ